VTGPLQACQVLDVPARDVDFLEDPHRQGRVAGRTEAGIRVGESGQDRRLGDPPQLPVSA